MNTNPYFLPNHIIPKGALGGDKVNEQANGNRISIEQLVNQRKQQDLRPIDVDILALVQGVTHNVTLLKHVWADNSLGQFDLFAAFGLPEDDKWRVVLALEEQ